MADPGNVRGDLDSIGEPDAGHLPQRRIRLLGGGSVHTRTNSALLRAAIERRARCLPAWRFSPITHKLVKRRHEFPLREINKMRNEPNMVRIRTRIPEKLQDTQSQQRGLLLRTGPCSNRRNRWN